MFKKQILLIILLISNLIVAQTHPAITHPVAIEQISGYQDYPEDVKKIILNAAVISEKQLTYLFGSADPKNGGMDCSGTIHYLLHSVGLKEVPRSANDMYNWVKSHGQLHSVSSNNLNAPDFANLVPGDLLFWSGTYAVSGMSHVMIYLGKDHQGKPLVFGSSDGRTYMGQHMWGVSVYDFSLPRPGSKGTFVGYGCAPGLTCGGKTAIDTSSVAENPVKKEKNNSFDQSKPFQQQSPDGLKPFPNW